MHNIVLFRPRQNICPFRNGYRPLRILSECETGDPQDRRLFLNASGVSQYQTSVGHETEEIQVTQWVNTTYA